MGNKILIVLIAVAIVITSVFIIRRWIEIKEKELPVGVQRVPEETRSVTLFFVGVEADGLIATTREIAVERGLEKQIKTVINELVGGVDDEEMVSAIPMGTEVLRVFWIEKTRTVYLDMNRAFVANHPGGSTSEYFTIASIVKTISENFPLVNRLQFLVDGSPVETIAGHYAVDKPLDVTHWE